LQFRESGATSDRDSGLCIIICTKQFLAKKMFLSSLNHRTLRILLQVTLAVPYSENCPQGDTFHSHGELQIECNGQSLEHSKINLLPVLSITAGLMCVCVCVCVCVRARELNIPKEHTILETECISTR
jgi:hypothetical protein